VGQSSAHARTPTANEHLRNIVAPEKKMAGSS
jgi:hypothetical protein